MRIRTLLSLVGILCVAAVSAHAYRLAFSDPQGAVRNYKADMTMKGTANVLGITAPLSSTISMTMTEKVLTKNADGTSSISFAVKNGKMVASTTIPGDDDATTKTQPLAFSMTYDRTPLGKVTNLKMIATPGGGADLLGAGMSGQVQYPGQGVQFPDKDLNIGDSWDTTQQIEPMPGLKVNMTQTNTLTATRVVNGKTLLVITSTFTADAKNAHVNVPLPAGNGVGDNKATQALTLDMTISGTSTALFDPQAGELGDDNFTLNISMNMQIGDAEAGGVNSTMTMTATGKMLRTK